MTKFRPASMLAIMFLALACNSFAESYSLSPRTVDAGGGVVKRSADPGLSTICDQGGISKGGKYLVSYGFIGQQSDIRTVELTMLSSPEDGGSTNPPGETTVFPGQKYEITATAGDTYKFIQWTIEGNAEIDDISSASTYVKLSSDSSVTANFDQTSLTLSSPNGGETWKIGSTHDITWTSQNVDGKIKIELLQGIQVNRLIEAGIENTGSYSWTIPAGQFTGSDYKIQIVNMNKISVNDSSENSFTIEDSTNSSLELTIPNGGEKWQSGKAQTITWKAEYFSGTVRIDLFYDGAFQKSVSLNTVNDGEYSWTPETDLSNGTLYAIRISDTSNSTVSDQSDGFFTIQDSSPPSATITVTNPAGGESWAPGSAQTITWTSDAVDGNIKIDLYRDGALDSSLSSSTENDGSFAWTVPATQTVSSEYRIRIASVDNAAVNAESNYFFAVTSKSEAYLNLLVTPASAGNTTPTTASLVKTGSVQNILASANSGYQFVMWSGDSNARISAPYSRQATVSIIDDATVTAVFLEEKAVKTVQIKINNSKDGKDQIKVTKAGIGKSDFGDSESVTVIIDNYQLGPLSKSQFTQKGSKNAWKYSSDKTEIVKIKLTLDFDKNIWDFSAKKLSDLAEKINNFDDLSLALVFNDNGNYECFGTIIPMDEKTSWNFNTKKNESSGSSGTDFSISKTTGSYNSDKTKNNKDKFSITKATLSTAIDYDPIKDNVMIVLDNYWEKTFPTTNTDSGQIETKYDWKEQGSVVDSKIKFTMDFEKGVWSMKLSKDDLFGLSAYDGIDVKLLIGDYTGKTTLHPTTKTTLKYKEVK